MNRKRRVSIALGVAIGVVVVGTAAVAVNSKGLVSRAFNRDMPLVVSEYRAAGLPWTQRDLNLPILQTGENAWDDLKVHSKRMSRTSRAHLREKVNTFLDKRDVAAAKAELASFGDETVAAQRASTKRGFRVHSDWSYGVWLDHNSRIEMFVLLLCLNSRLAALEGDMERARAFLKDAGNLSALGRQETHLTGLLRHIVSEGMILDASLEVAHELAKRGGDLSVLAPFFERTLDYEILPRALRGEMYIDLATIRNMPRQRELLDGRDGLDDEVTDQVGHQILENHPAPEDVTQSIVVDRLLTTYLKQCLERAPISRELALDPIGASAKYDSLLDAQEDRWLMSGFAATIFSSDMSGPAKAIVRHEARRRANHSLLKVLTFRSRIGRWPKDLREAGAEGEDPFNRGMTLKSTMTADEITVYSIGPNMKDDRGRFGKLEQRIFDDVAVKLRKSVPAEWPPKLTLE